METTIIILAYIAGICMLVIALYIWVLAGIYLAVKERSPKWELKHQTFTIFTKIPKSLLERVLAAAGS